MRSGTLAMKSVQTRTASGETRRTCLSNQLCETSRRTGAGDTRQGSNTARLHRQGRTPVNCRAMSPALKKSRGMIEAGTGSVAGRIVCAGTGSVVGDRRTSGRSQVREHGLVVLSLVHRGAGRGHRKLRAPIAGVDVWPCRRLGMSGAVLLRATVADPRWALIAGANVRPGSPTVGRGAVRSRVTVAGTAGDGPRVEGTMGVLDRHRTGRKNTMSVGGVRRAAGRPMDIRSG